MRPRFRIFNIKTGETVIGDDVSSMDVDDVGFEEYDEPNDDDELEFIDSDDKKDVSLDGLEDKDDDSFELEDEFELDDDFKDDLDDLDDQSNDFEEFDTDELDFDDESQYDNNKLDDEMDSDTELDVGEDDLDLDEPSENGQDSEIDLDDEEVDADEDYQGNIRTIRGAHLVYKRATEDGTFEELWIYNVGKNRAAEAKIRNAIMAGSDVDVNRDVSEDGSQKVETYTVGNVQYIKLIGVNN